MMLNLGNNIEIWIKPAHVDRIIDISLLNTSLVTSSLDNKIKFWVYSAQENKFQFLFSHTHPVDISTSKVYNGLIIIGSSSGALTVYSPIQNPTTNNYELQSTTHFDVFHNQKITHFFFQDKYIISSSLDQKINILDNIGNIVNSTYNAPITYFTVAKNRNEKEVLVIGFDNGIIELYDSVTSNNPYGELLVHKGQAINCIYNSIEKINDVCKSILIIGDRLGRISFWEFKNQSKI